MCALRVWQCRGCSVYIEVCIGDAVRRGCSMPQAAGQAEAVQGSHLGQCLGRKVCVSEGTCREGAPQTGVRDKRAHMDAQPCMDTARYCRKRHLWVPHPALLAQLAQPPRPWGPPAAFEVEGHLPYSEALAGVWLCEGAGSSGFRAGTGLSWLWVLLPPGAGEARGWQANRMPGEQEQVG